MDFRSPDLSKIVDFDKIEKEASKASTASKGIDKLAIAKMILKPIMKTLPPKAKYLIGFAILSLVTGVVTLVYLLLKLVGIIVTALI